MSKPGTPSASSSTTSTSATECSISTIYRVLDRCPELLESDDGMVGFISEKIRQDISEIVSVQREQLTTAADAVAHLLNLDRETLRQRGGAFEKWLTEYAIELVENGDGDRVTFKIKSMVDRLRSTSIPRLDDVLREGLRAWTDAGLDPHEFHRARVKWRARDGSMRSGIVKSALR